MPDAISTRPPELAVVLLDAALAELDPVVAAALVAAPAPVVPALEAADCEDACASSSAIWAWIVELKVPVMSESVNFAEKTSVAFEPSEVIRMKLYDGDQNEQVRK